MAIFVTFPNTLKEVLEEKEVPPSANTYQKNMKIIRIGGHPKPFWRVEIGSKLPLKTVVLSPLKVWRKFKNAYVNMMVNLVGNVNGNALVDKRIPKARQVQHAYSTSEFDSRLIFEIYKTLLVNEEMNFK
ncbi:hypothetical protein LguiB_019247 [Lonicera macranthoides]